MPSITKLERLDNGDNGTGGNQLVVDSQPFLLRPAELNNSSFSSSAYMAEAFPRLVENNVNTVLGSVSWEQIEPREGEFEFGELDRVIEGARESGLKVVILWFGAFKNGLSTYAPGWVKTDPKRFPRARILKTPGQKPIIQDVFSLFNPNILDADSKAFKKLMEHIKEVDEGKNTVIMIQVENEVGLRGDSRDRSDAANDPFDGPVPEHIVNRLKDEWDNLKPTLREVIEKAGGLDKVKGKSKSWEATFGSSQQTDELFMAYHYATYVDTVARVGKDVYPVPMYTNAWQPSPEVSAAGGGDVPGIYPSGGPVPSVLDIWQLFAPSLDFLAPDIYMGDYDSVCRSYLHRGQLLFIPEQRRDEYGALRIWSAIGQFGALGTSPFGIDTDNPATSAFTSHFKLLGEVAPLILEARQKGRQTYGFYFDNYEPNHPDPSPPRTATFGHWVLHVRRAGVFGHPGPGYGMIIALPDHEFILIGEGYEVQFEPTDPKATFSSVLSFEEKRMIDGEMVTERLLNGDETSMNGSTGSVVRMPGPDPDYGGFPIAISIPSRTRLATCKPYYLTE